MPRRLGGGGFQASSGQPASLLEWRNYRHQRVFRSTLAAEATSLDRAEDYGYFLQMHDNHQATMRATLIDVVPVTDVRSLWDCVDLSLVEPWWDYLGRN